MAKKTLRLASINVVTHGVGGDPLTVAEESIKEYSESNNNCDTVYCIVDRDKHPKNKFIEARNKLSSSINKKKFRLILSYPCIEYWFLLHLGNDTHPYHQPIDGNGSMGRLCKRRLKDEHYSEYDESNTQILNKFFNATFTKVTRLEAINRAKKLINNIVENDTINPSTMLFIPAIDIGLMANSNLKLQTITKNGKPIIETISQEKYEQYIKEFFDIFIKQKNL